MNKFKKILILSTIFLLSVGVGVGVSRFIPINSHIEKSESMGISIDSKRVDSSILVSGKGEAVSLNSIPEIISIETPRYDFQLKTYNLSVIARVETGDALMYYIMQTEEDDVLCESENGVFASIPPSNKGYYYLKIINRRTKECSPIKKISGFGIPVDKISARSLTIKINNTSPSSVASLSKYFAKKYSIKFVNLSVNDAKPTTYSEISTRIISGVWESVTVISIDEYDDENKITSLTIRVKYGDNEML